MIQNIRKYQVHQDVTVKPEAIVMCCEFPERAAIVKCLHDLDFYSQEGWEITHQTGKRKGYKKERVVQNVCSVYGDRPATCKVGDVLYSEEAYVERAEADADFRNLYRELTKQFIKSIQIQIRNQKCVAMIIQKILFSYVDC